MVRRVAIVIVASVALHLASPDARAAPELAITPPSGEPGDEMTAYAVGFTPGATITLLWNAQPDAVLETGTADASGQAVIVFNIPLDETAGAAVVWACGGSGGCVPGGEFAQATIDVVPAPLVGDDGSGAWLPLLLIALFALVLGQVTRRRWSRTSETFKPLPPKKHDHEFEQPAEVGRPPWQDREP